MNLRPVVPMLLVLVMVPAAAQRGSQSHRWALLLQAGADRVEIDSAAIRARHGIMQVWLRWSATTGAPDLTAVYSIEQREIDCRQERTRVLRKEHLGGDDTTAATTAGSEPSWHRPSSGSLLALATTAACRWSTQTGT